MGKYFRIIIGLLIFYCSLFAEGKNQLTNGVVLPISTDSLIAYYPLDVDARDYSGNGLHGTVYGAKPFTDSNARPNPAMYFDGKDDYIDLGNSKKFKPDFPISVCAWVEFERFWGEWFFTNNYDEDYYNGIWLGAGIGGVGYPVASFGNGGLTTPFGGRTFRGTDTLRLHKWYHFTAIYFNSQHIELLIDGAQIKGKYLGFASSFTYSDGPALLGKKDTNYDAPPWYFKGAVDELFLFQRVLSVDEIRKLMNFTHKPFPGAPR